MPVREEQYSEELGIGALTMPEIDSTIGRDAFIVAEMTGRARALGQEERNNGRLDLERLAADLSSTPEMLPLLLAAIQQVPQIDDPSSPIEQLRKLTRANG